MEPLISFDSANDRFCHSICFELLSSNNKSTPTLLVLKSIPLTINLSILASPDPFVSLKSNLLHIDHHLAMVYDNNNIQQHIVLFDELQ